MCWPARDVVETLNVLVRSTHTSPDWNSDDPTRRIPIPAPDFVRDYLSRALLKIASGTPRDPPKRTAQTD